MIHLSEEFPLVRLVPNGVLGHQSREVPIQETALQSERLRKCLAGGLFNGHGVARLGAQGGNWVPRNG